MRPEQKEPIMTTENIFSAVLTFSLLAGGAVAFGSELGQHPQAPARVATATLPTVTVTGHCAGAVAEATLPTVTVVGHRAAPAALAEAALPTVTVVGRRVAPIVAVETDSVEQHVQ
jgi:hypothetical protein